MSGRGGGDGDALAADRLALLDRLLGDDGGEERIEPRPGGGPAPLSFPQQRLWVLQELEPDSAAYNVVSTARFATGLDLGRLQRAVVDAVHRQEALRTVFERGEDGQARQVPLRRFRPALPRVDLRALGVAAERCALVLAQEMARRSFDLTVEPPLRLLALRLPKSTLLVTVVHHIVSDARSADIFRREVEEGYAARSAGRAPAWPELPVQYADFALWQRRRLADGSEVLERELDYWRRTLDGMPPLLELPTDRPRPAARSWAGAVRARRLPAALRPALRQLTGGGVTPFMVFLAAFLEILGRYAGRLDPVVGTPVAGRVVPEVEDLVGCFVNTLVLRGNRTGRPTFGEMVARVRDVCLGAFDHQELPFEKLVDGLGVEREMSYTPLFQVLFTLGAGGRTGAGITGAAEDDDGPALPEVTTGTARVDLSVVLEEHGAGWDALAEYSTDLFDATTVERLLHHCENLLAAALADPDRPVAELPLLTAEERQAVARDWAFGGAAEPWRGGVLREVLEWCERTPDAMAVVGPDGAALTYGQLVAAAGALAARLREGGDPDPEVPVAVFMERSVGMVAAILAVLLAGAPYLPLDPAYPRRRLELLLADSGCRQVLVDPERRDLVDALGGIEVVPVSPAAPDPPTAGPLPVGAAVAPEALAYVIYTSGSTGLPKGVEVPHRGLANLVRWHHREYGVRSGDRATWLAGTAFDASVWELWPYLTRGAVLHIPDPETLASPPVLVRWLVERRIDLCFLPTPLAEVVLGEPWPPRPPLRALLTGGDKLHGSALRPLPFPLVNHYGPTENSVVATAGTVVSRNDGRDPSIGRPIAGVTAYVLDRDLNPVPAGVAGELCLAGASLARGYRGRPGQTAERFVPDPFSHGGRLYRTGDLARWHPRDARIGFLGRADHQVKVRGFRIEPGEVEAVLATHAAVKRGLVLLRSGALTGYVVPRGDAAPEPEELRRFLAERLPEYMVPAAFVLLDRFPLTPNGKVDREALPEPAQPAGAVDAVRTLPRNELESRLAAVWAEVLGVGEVDVHRNFFELGGDSIQAIQVAARAARVGLDVSARQIFQHPTVGELASVVAVGGGVVEAEQGAVSGPVPLTPIQHWFFDLVVADPHHFNQAVMLAPRRPLLPDLLARAVARLLLHHDALRMRFEPTDGGWRQVNLGPEGCSAPLLHVVDLTAVPAAGQGRLRELVAGWVQASLDLRSGPLLRAVLFELEGGRQRLLLVIHHLVVDGVSWRILLADLESVCGDLEQGRDPLLPPKTTSFRRWAEGLVERARRGFPAEERQRWLADPEGTVEIPRDRLSANDPRHLERTVGRDLAEEDTAELSRTAPRLFDVRIHEVLAAVVARAAARWAGGRKVLLGLESHGREDLVEDADVSRTVGWFTSFYPLALTVDPEAAPQADLAAVRDRLRAVPQGGVGFGLLRYLADDEEAARRLAAQPEPGLVLNYLGRFGGGGGSAVDGGDAAGEPLLAVIDEGVGRSESKAGDRRTLLELNAMVARGRLRLHCTHGAQHDGATVERFLDDVAGELARLAAHCRERSATGAEPGEPDEETEDFGWSTDEMDAITASIEQAIDEE